MEIWATSMEAFNTEDINQYYALSQKINSKKPIHPDNHYRLQGQYCKQH